jgi:hypothetical protein
MITMMVTENKIENSTLYKQAWDYFQLHSSQRLTTFNFYLVISSVVTAGLVSTLQKNFAFPQAGVLLGSLLSFFSFVFWVLDRRNGQLIKNAEAALRFFEGQYEPENQSGDEPHVTKIFTRDEFSTAKNRRSKSILFWKNHYSYSDCFTLVFLSFGIIGIVGAVGALISIRFK